MAGTRSSWSLEEPGVVVGSASAPRGTARSASNDRAAGIVDAHHHLWDLAVGPYPWLRGRGDAATTSWIGEYAAIRRSWLVQDYLRDADGVNIVASVHVEAGWGDRSSISETQWLQAVADRHGFPHAIVVAVDLGDVDAERQLDQHLEFANVRGVRMTRMGPHIGEAAFLRGFAAVAARGMSYDLNLRIEDVPLAVGLVNTFPDTPIVIGNLANPRTLDRGALNDWTSAMHGLSDAGNVTMKLSGFGMADHSWTVDVIRPWVRAALEAFSPDRCMFGSNWPVDRLYGTLPQLVGAVRSIVEERGPDAVEAVFASTARRIYRI
jgi:predicted TIM-barrel fold metal-dependent hydrolase